MSAEKREGGASPAARHLPVLVQEVLQWLALEPRLVVADGTVGAGGHARRILERIGPEGTLIGLDRDPGMLELAALSVSGPNCFLRQASYRDLDGVLEELGIDKVDRILIDLGVSSDQLTDPSRGFGFQAGGPLDLRFDPELGEPAWRLIERSSASQLEDIFRQFGQERFSRPIARGIVARQAAKPIRRAEDLIEVVASSVPRKFQAEARTHSATRVFQALRIAVNAELEHLHNALEGSLYTSLRPGGRIVAISFHSLEDRMVKQAFRNADRWENLTPKPITASAVERKVNPRCRSAKLRAARRT